ncbi:MAG: substrate-binding domain-containing protein [Rhodobacterales bacterium]|nr:substrate-binding domain-containing protein [Rhodobacterales bacterium]
MDLFRGAFLAGLFLIMGFTPASAQDVTLSSRDGTVTISGTLLGFDGEFYRVDTLYGELTLDGSGVNCEGPGCPNLVNFVASVTFSGAATMGDVLMPALISAFARRSGLALNREDIDATHFNYVFSDKTGGNDVGRFSFHLSNTDEGFADLLANEADIVLSLREVRPTESKRAKEAGMGNLLARGRARVIALDALVAITALDNPVQAITTPDLARVLAGEIDNWQGLGGPDAPISVHLRDAKSGLGQAAEDRLLRPLNLSLSASATRHTTDAALAAAVANDPFSIGVASHAKTANTAVLVLSGDCGFALAPTRRTIKTEDYPLTSPMFLYLPARRLPKLAREFLVYTRSRSAQLVIRRAGFVDQSPEDIAINDQGSRFANAIARAGSEVSLGDLKRMVQVLDTRKRLSTTFRFNAGSAVLDAQSRSNVAHLAHDLEAGYYEGRELLFVGFSDGDGPAGPNRTISARRARAVRDAVIAAAVTANLDNITLGTDAFGEALPMACDDSAWGRQVNRRVEVWLR